MRATRRRCARLCAWCAERGIAIGAQVSYRDRAGFGRRDVEIGYDDLRADIAEQLALLARAAEAAGVRVAYLKPHGALYNRAAWDREQASAVVDSAKLASLPVLGLPGSVILALAGDAGLPVAREFFADRGYAADGTLVPRSEPTALVTQPAQVAERVGLLVDSGTVVAVDGSTVDVPADSICVHGDTSGALDLARAVATVLAEHDIGIAAFR